MNLVSVKAISEVHLNGVKIDWVKEDKNVKEVRFHDGNGGRIVIRAGTYGDVLKVMVPQPFEEAERWMLHGRFLDVADIKEYFEYEHDAKDKLREYGRKASGDDCGLCVEKVKVKVDDAGSVVETSAAGRSPSDDEIPF